jgi:hypothetical protein
MICAEAGLANINAATTAPRMSDEDFMQGMS